MALFLPITMQLSFCELINVLIVPTETEPPVIVADYSATQVLVPKEAANSEIGFLTKIVDVNEGKETVESQ